MTQDNSIVIREYLTTDKEVVMNLIKLNTPNFFAKEEVNDLSNYLDKEIELYYVLLVDGKVVGCGGINFAEKRTIGKISWDIMHPDYQGKSLGKKLLRYRIKVLKAIPSIKKITVRTSQLAYKFYEKQGFTLNESNAIIGLTVLICIVCNIMNYNCKIFNSNVSSHTLLTFRHTRY